MAKNKNVKWYGDKYLKEFNTKLEIAMKKAVLLVEADAKRLCPVDENRLRSSINNAVERITKDILRGRVGTPLEYGRYVAFGTKPHFPPPEALAGWAKRHGMEGAEYAIALKIAEEGTEAQPFLRPALENNWPEIVRLIRSALR